jgi:uncharacterized protein involved in exopolysaccharide biosynthesis
VELARQVEMARIQIRKDTPIFTVIEPVVVPNSRIRPRRTQIVILVTFLGVILGIVYSFGLPFFKEFIKKMKEG